MMKTEDVRSRMVPKRKRVVGQIFKKLGLTHSEAINLFYAQVELQHGLPFRVEIPNELTAKTLKETKEGKNIKTFSSKEEMFKDLDL